MLALSGAAWAPQALADDYLVGNEVELRAAITAANANPDASATIRLTGSFEMSNRELPSPTKPVTIDTQGFTLRVPPGATAIFIGTSAPATFAGTFVGVDADPAGNAAGANALKLNSSTLSATAINNGTFTNNASVVLGYGGEFSETTRSTRPI